MTTSGRCIIPPTLSADLSDPWIVAERPEPFWRELAPCRADGIKDGAVTFMEPVRQVALAEIEPDPFNGVQLR